LSLAFDLEVEAPRIPSQYLDRSSKLGYLTSLQIEARYDKQGQNPI
jgi:hypothetical protein